MIIATWNVNSVLARLPLVLKWLGSARPDVLCLQETKCADERFPADEFAALGYTSATYGQPTYTGHLAESLLQVADGDDFGIHHRSGRGQCSWYELTRFVFERAGIDCWVEPCTTTEFPRPAPRPAYSVLGSERGQPSLPDWQRGVEEYLAAREIRA